tara:strand:- start:478 stop:744 length:267 start_codon:yes stop_codon:yes gene_type:complete
MKQKSKKMQRIDTKYRKLRTGYLNDFPMCQAALPSCTNKSTDVHHKKGRGIYHNDITTWLSVCRTCHNWIELHPIEAEELGFSINRIT